MMAMEMRRKSFGAEGSCEVLTKAGKKNIYITGERGRRKQD